MVGEAGESSVATYISMLSLTAVAAPAVVSLQGVIKYTRTHLSHTSAVLFLYQTAAVMFC